MATPGTELVMGVRTDPVFGPLLAVGLGGIHVEVLRDIRFGLVPATPVTARRLLERLRAFPILKGVRGGTPVDLDKVVDALLRLSALVNEHPEIAEVEMNPVFARPDGVEAVDVRLRVVSVVPTPVGPAPVRPARRGPGANPPPGGRGRYLDLRPRWPRGAADGPPPRAGTSDDEDHRPPGPRL